MIIDVFVDGSSINNGKRNCKAGYGVFFPQAEYLNISQKINEKEEKVSNNVAEIIACIRAIEISDETFHDLEKLRIFSDSEYTINCVTKWCETWKKNNWVKYDKKPIKNLDLIKKLYDYYLEYPIEFIHVRSHQTMPSTDTKEYYYWYGNNAADLLAKKSIIVL